MAVSRVFLVGPMGAGKTAVGRQLARRLHFSFSDSDHEVETRTGVDIPFIFEKEGEAGFRRREKDAIDRLTQRDRIVLATGGGVVLDAGNRECLAARGYVVYLHASIEQQLERTSRGNRRPLLHTEDPRTALENLMREREPLYLEIANAIIETDGRRVAAVAAELYGRLDEERV
ncbi:MAG: shikimate kinase AroK [Gammaproteobacteria bacterium]|nr:shikimate kinase AroK [Gammaproteobacteria bacterium]